MKICIKNGLVINPKTQMEQISDVWIEDGKVSYIGQLEDIADLSTGKVFDGRTNLLEAFKVVRGYN